MTTVQENIEFQLAVKAWGEAMLAHLYPGAMLMMFAGPRMWEWVATGMALAGYLHWDTIMWITAQGFPKAQDIGGKIAKARGEKPIAEIPNPAFLFMPNSGQTSTGWKGVIPETKQIYANEWQGYKTAALKPAYEPILCFRVPRGKLTHAELALQYGTGALNVDGCRIGTEELSEAKAGQSRLGTFIRNNMVTPARTGRYPANVILDEAAAILLNRQSGISKSRKIAAMNPGKITPVAMNWGLDDRSTVSYEDSGGASRFFFCPKASPNERNAGCEDLENDHPCVKPLALIRHLATLLLPPTSVGSRRILVPFCGSGSEMIGAYQAGWDEIVGIEQDAHYCEIAKRRLDYWRKAS